MAACVLYSDRLVNGIVSFKALLMALMKNIWLPFLLKLFEWRAVASFCFRGVLLYG